jgi:hypothetical protein
LLSPRFEQIALIDFAFSLVSGESLTRALPIARQHDYDYQSPRLLQALEAGSWGDLLPTRQLDWRCDVFSLAAMLRRYLPDPEAPLEGTWTRVRHAQARALVRRLLEAHDAERPTQRPHLDLVALTAHALDDDELAASLARGWALAIDSEAASDAWPTPVTRIAMPVSVDLQAGPPAIARLDQARQGRARARRVAAAVAAASLAAIGAPLLYDAWWAAREREVADVSSAMPAPPIPARPATEVEAAAVARALHRGQLRQPRQAGLLRQQHLPPDHDGTWPAGAAVRSPTAVAKSGPAAAGTTAVPSRAQARSNARPATRPPTSAVPPLSERERALAWLTMRGPAPRSAARSGLSAGPAVALAPAPMAAAAAPASAAAPALPAVSLPAPTPVPGSAPGSVSAQVPMPTQMPKPSPVPAPAPSPVPAYAPESVSAQMPMPAQMPKPPPIPAPAPIPVPGSAPGSVSAQAQMPTQTPKPSPIPVPSPTDFAVRANELMTTDLPRLMQRVEQRVLRVMDIAAQPETPWQDEQIRRAAGASGTTPTSRCTLSSWRQATLANCMKRRGRRSGSAAARARPTPSS